MNNHYINKAIDLVEAAKSELVRRNVTGDADVVALIAQIQWAVEELKPTADQVWADISTAPRNQRILVYCPSDEPDRRTVFEAWWRTPYEGAPPEQCWWCYDGDKTMLSADVHKSPKGEPLGATMWTSLPAPPVVRARARGAEEEPEDRGSTT